MGSPKDPCMHPVVKSTVDHISTMIMAVTWSCESCGEAFIPVAKMEEKLANVERRGSDEFARDYTSNDL